MIVIIESPCLEETELNSKGIRLREAYLKHCIVDSIERGETPITANLLYPQLLDLPRQAPVMDNLILEYLKKTDYMAVYTDMGITANMKKNTNLAIEKGVKVEHRKLNPVVFDRFFKIRVNPKYLWEEICRVSNIEVDIKNSKIRENAYLKHIYAVIAVELFPQATYTQIGACINKDHSVISYYLKEIGKVKEKTSELSKMKKKLFL